LQTTPVPRKRGFIVIGLLALLALSVDALVCLPKPRHFSFSELALPIKQSSPAEIPTSL
jgi:hypothetical protein